MERTHLTELRKIHYHLAGAAEGWDDVSITVFTLTFSAVVLYEGLGVTDTICCFSFYFLFSRRTPEACHAS